jgi:hypothetical protein
MSPADTEDAEVCKHESWVNIRKPVGWDVAWWHSACLACVRPWVRSQHQKRKKKDKKENLSNSIHNLGIAKQANSEVSLYMQCLGRDEIWEYKMLIKILISSNSIALIYIIEQFYFILWCGIFTSFPTILLTALFWREICGHVYQKPVYSMTHFFRDYYGYCKKS